MSTVRSMEVMERQNAGTGPARALRRTGYVPAVIYGNKTTPVMAAIEERLLVKEMKEKGFSSHLFSISLGGKKEQVLIRSIQLHPVSDRPVHVDFLRVSQDSRITVDVPLTFLNEDAAPGIRQGGVLNVMYHALPLICSPNQIPEVIEVDLTGLEIGTSISLTDIKIPSSAKVAHPEKIDTVFNIVAPKVASAESESSESSPAPSGSTGAGSNESAGD